MLLINILQNIHMKTFMYSDFKEGVCLIKYEKWQFERPVSIILLFPRYMKTRLFLL